MQLINFLKLIEEKTKMKNFGWTEAAERLNGRLSMEAFPIMVVVYLKTGQLLPVIS